jgi:hypothetical protein
MKLTASNSNNQPPEVSQDDSWSDAEDPAEGKIPLRTVLPSRRSLVDQPTPVSRTEVGLRIESTLARSAAPNSSSRIEVQEINREVIRLEQAVDAPARIERHFTFQEKQEPLDTRKSLMGESRDWGMSHRLPIRWILGMALIVGLVVIGCLMLLPVINAPNAPPEDPNKGLLTVVDEEKIGGMENLDRLLTRQTEAFQIFRSFAQAIHPDEVVPLIVDGRTLYETLRKHWRPLDVPREWEPAADCAWSVLEFGGKAYGLLEGRLPDYSSFTAYFTFQDERLLLDWKATTAFGTASFRQLSEGTGDGSEIRGSLSKAEFYSATWPEEDYQSYRLTTPNEEASLWCYSRRGETAKHSISSLFNSGEITGEAQSVRKVTLRLARGPAEALPNQWLIEEMIHIDWGTR